jgi:glycosyltransferase involved in cell wall biosynthesis
VSPDRGRTSLLFVVNVDWFFLSHRLPIARAAAEAGYDVTVAAADTGQAGRIRAAGLRFVPLELSRKGIGPVSEARALARLVSLYRRERPDIVHHVTIKPVLYGSLAARAAGVPVVINAVSGLGYAFTGEGRRTLRAVVQSLYRAGLSNPRAHTIFQNPDDMELFVSRRLLRAPQAVLIRGAGVDCAEFRVRPEPAGPPIVLLPARMLWDKGVGAFVEAARLLRARAVPARFVLVGDSDPGNPTAVPVSTLEAWVREGVVEWWGARDDMPDVLSQAAIVVLPSRREGLPKVLLEAAACGRAIVATDVPGCREAVLHGRTGLLVDYGDSAALAEAIAQLAAEPALRTKYGRAGRALAEREFAVERVVSETLALYRRVLREVQHAGADRRAA